MDIDEKLNKAFTVFLKYGYRKASMDDVANEIGISRQALYKHYSSKKDLFDAVVDKTMKTSETMVFNVLNNKSIPFHERLVLAMDCFIGQYLDELKTSPHGNEVILLAENGERAKKSHENYITLLQQICKEEKIAKTSEEIYYLVVTWALISKGLVHSEVSREEFLFILRKSVNIIFKT
jgi:AcrR family transcriptional regulator